VKEKAAAGFDEGALAKAINVNAALAPGGLEHVPEGGDMDPSEDFDVDLVLDVPLAAHVPMEPRTAVARFDGESKLEVWTGSQDVFLARSVLSDEMHLSEDDVTVHGMRTGGAFGGKTMCFVELEAARLARAAGRPVKIQWSRRDEFAAAFHRPPSQHRIRARIGADGRLDAWWHAFRSGHVIFSSAFMGRFLQFATSFVADIGVKRGSLPPYAAARKRIEFEDVRLPIPTGPWRGLGAGPNTWAIETAMDALARKAGRDPLAFRLDVLANDNPRLAGVLKEVAARSGWPTRRTNAKRGYGVACGIYKGVTYAAVVAEVMIEKSDPPRVTHLWCAHDCGLVINLDQVRAQIEGNLVWGLGMVLHEKLEVGEGRIEAESHADYALPRFSDVPDIETTLIGGEHPPSGAGEAAIIASGAAITNAIAALTGETVTRLPYAR
jgi:CO/xanthine dehydrogenase Mo-binding subunit